MPQSWCGNYDEIEWYIQLLPGSTCSTSCSGGSFKSANDLENYFKVTMMINTMTRMMTMMMMMSKNILQTCQKLSHWWCHHDVRIRDDLCSVQIHTSWAFCHQPLMEVFQIRWINSICCKYLWLSKFHCFRLATFYVNIGRSLWDLPPLEMAFRFEFGQSGYLRMNSKMWY